ncbi:MAG: RNA-binding S4 domain-containing protein [Arenicellales bacterium]
MNDIIINKPTVELFKILKFEGLASSGGEAKSMIAEGQVKLNGQVETQKRKKINAGDTITFAGQNYAIKTAE